MSALPGCPGRGPTFPSSHSPPKSVTPIGFPQMYRQTMSRQAKCLRFPRRNRRFHVKALFLPSFFFSFCPASHVHMPVQPMKARLACHACPKRCAMVCGEGEGLVRKCHKVKCLLIQHRSWVEWPLMSRHALLAGQGTTRNGVEWSHKKGRAMSLNRERIHACH